MSGASSDDRSEVYRNVTNEARLLETQKPHEVRHTASGVELTWHNAHRLADHIVAKLEPAETQRLIEVIHQYNNPLRPMGKLHEAALRIKAKKAELEAEADKILKRLDGLDAKSPDVFDRAGKVIAAQNTDLDAMDSELRQLSNLEST